MELARGTGERLHVIEGLTYFSASRLRLQVVPFRVAQSPFAIISSKPSILDSRSSSLFSRTSKRRSRESMLRFKASIRDSKGPSLHLSTVRKQRTSPWSARCVPLSMPPSASQDIQMNTSSSSDDQSLHMLVNMLE